jgi:hypothetical protein
VSGYADRLAHMDGHYEAAPVAGGFDDLPPDGDYQCVIDRFDFVESQKNGRLYLKTLMSVAAGPLKGRRVSCLHDLEDPDRLKYLKKHLSVLEVEPVSLRHLEAELHKALDVPVLVAVKTNGEFRNVYVNQRLGAPIRQSDVTDPPPLIGGVPQPQSTNAIAGDDIPF